MPAESRPARSESPFLVTADGAGGLTRMQARHPRFGLTSRGVRLPIATAGDEPARWLAAQLPLRPESVLSHTTAARVHRLPLPRGLDGEVGVHVTTPRECPRPRRRDIVTHHARLPVEDVMSFGELRVTTPERTYVDMAALLRFDDLVALGDVVLRDHPTTQERLLGVAEARLRYNGRRAAVSAVAWLDARSASPRESHLRVLLRRAGLPRPEVNGLITDEYGGFLAIGDLVFRRQRVIVEYDGDVHAPMGQRARDAARRAVLREHGWIVVEVVGEDMHYPARVIARVRAALRDGATTH
jgi:very-short-patch-repair endonuclease